MFRSCYKCFAGFKASITREQILWYQGNKNKQQTSENVSFTPHSHLSIIPSLYIFLPASVPPHASFIPLRNQKPFLGLSMQGHTNTFYLRANVIDMPWLTFELQLCIKGKKERKSQSPYFILLVRISWVRSAAVILAKWIKYVVLECHRRPSSFFFPPRFSLCCGKKKKSPFFAVFFFFFFLMLTAWQRLEIWWCRMTQFMPVTIRRTAARCLCSKLLPGCKTLHHFPWDKGGGYTPRPPTVNNNNWVFVRNLSSYLVYHFVFCQRKETFFGAST